MEPYWNLFVDTGDPLAYLLYRGEQDTPVQTGAPASESDTKEAMPWQPPPIS